MDIFSFLIIWAISIPFFYIWGFISFIRFLDRGSRKQSSIADRNDFLKTTISELKNAVSENPDKKLTDLLTTYEEELKRLPPVESTQSVEPATQAHNDDSFQNWYKDNSINLLLYIGAFLIIVSASIYV